MEDDLFLIQEDALCSLNYCLLIPAEIKKGSLAVWRGYRSADKQGGRRHGWRTNQLYFTLLPHRSRMEAGSFQCEFSSNSEKETQAG